MTYMEHFSPAGAKINNFNNVLPTPALLTKNKKKKGGRAGQGCLAEPFHKADRALPPPHCIPLHQETAIAAGVGVTKISCLRKEKKKVFS